MSTTITAQDGSGASTVPALVLGYEAEQGARNIVHDIIGGGIAVTLVRPRPRAGTLNLFYLTEAAANTARLLHLRETSFALASTDLTTVDMQYVVAGSVKITLDDDGRRRWVLEVGFQEIEV